MRLAEAALSSHCSLAPTARAQRSSLHATALRVKARDITRCSYRPGRKADRIQPRIAGLSSANRPGSVDLCSVRLTMREDVPFPRPLAVHHATTGGKSGSSMAKIPPRLLDEYF